MKACLALMLASLCGVAASPAIAGTQTGFVKSIYARDSDGVVIVDLAGNAASLHPTCAVQTYWVIPNESSDSGKRLLTLLLSAQLSFRVVTIIGKDTCNRWGDGEDIDTVGIGGVQNP
jgi:hypothetical protein